MPASRRELQAIACLRYATNMVRSIKLQRRETARLHRFNFSEMPSIIVPLRKAITLRGSCSRMIRNSGFLITPRLRALNKDVTRLRPLRKSSSFRKGDSRGAARLSKSWMFLSRLALSSRECVTRAELNDGLIRNERVHSRLSQSAFRVIERLPTDARAFLCAKFRFQVRWRRFEIAVQRTPSEVSDVRGKGFTSAQSADYILIFSPVMNQRPFPDARASERDSLGDSESDVVL